MKSKLTLTKIELAFISYLFFNLISISCYGQFCSGSQTQVSLKNLIQTGPGKLECDLVIKNTGTTSVSLLALGAGFTYPSGMVPAGATMSGTITKDPFISALNNFNSNGNVTHQAATNQIRWAHTPISGVSVLLSGNNASMPIAIDHIVAHIVLQLNGIDATTGLPYVWPTNFPANLVLNYGLSPQYSNTISLVYCNGNTNSTALSSLIPGSQTISNPITLFLSVPTICATSMQFSNVTPTTCFAGSDGILDFVLISPTPTITSGTYSIDGVGAISYSSLPQTISGLSAGTHTILATSSDANCPIPISGIVSISEPAQLTNSINVESCETYTWLVNNTTYSSSGIFFGTSINSSGCFVMETLNLAIINPNDIALTNSGNATSITGNVSSTVMSHTDGTAITYTDGCRPIVTISDAVGGNILGNVITNAVVTNSITPSNGYLGFIYGKRSIIINASSDGSGIVTLFFTQDDFNNYNANNSGFLDLPASSTDVTSIPYLRIARVNGAIDTTAYGFGLTMTWNASNSIWQIEIPISTFVNGQYFFYTQPDCIGVEVNNVAVSINTLIGNSAIVTWDLINSTPYLSGSYSIQYRIASPQGAWIYAGTSSTTTNNKTISGLTAGQTYQVQVRKDCSQYSFGNWSSLVNFTMPNTICNSPATINTPIVPTSTTVTLSWPSLGVGVIYSIWYKLSTATNWSTPSTTANSLTLTGLIPEATYNVAIRNKCTSSSTYSAFSPTLNFTMTNNACATPAIISTPITTTNTTAVINWSSVPGVATYFLWYKKSSSTTWSTPSFASSITSFTLTNLQVGTSYDVAIRNSCASNGIISPFSSIISFTTANNACAFPATIITPIPTTNTTATIKWNAIPGVSTYYVWYKLLTATNWNTPSTTADSIKFTGLIPNTTYNVAIRNKCANTGVVSPFSSILNFTTGSALKFASFSELEVSKYKIFPNPTVDYINIEFESENYIKTNVKVYDITGRVVKEVQVKAQIGLNNISINLYELVSGIYTLKVFENDRLNFKAQIQKN